jgi:hypothetical protein
MDDINVEWLDQKSPINNPFKGFDPTDLLLPQLTFSNPIFGHELPKKIGFLEKNSPFLNVGRSSDFKS